MPSDDAREHRWRATAGSLDFDAGAEEDEEFQAASALARAAMLEISDDAVRAYLAHERSFSPAWREAAAFLQPTIVATPAELTALAEQMFALLAPYLAGTRERRPRGSRLVDLSIRAVPKP